MKNKTVITGSFEKRAPGDDSDEIWVVSDTAAVTLDDEQLMTLQLSSGNYLRFQPDTGEQCNIIPVQVYRPGDLVTSLRETGGKISLPYPIRQPARSRKFAFAMSE